MASLFQRFSRKKIPFRYFKLFAVPFAYNQLGDVNRQMTIAFVLAANLQVAETRVKNHIEGIGDNYCGLIDKIMEIQIEEWEKYVSLNWPMFTDSLPTLEMLLSRQTGSAIYLLPAITLKR